jgi:hypothetical protein
MRMTRFLAIMCALLACWLAAFAMASPAPHDTRSKAELRSEIKIKRAEIARTKAETRLIRAYTRQIERRSQKLLTEIDSMTASHQAPARRR